MCEQTEINYLDGDIVWVKLGSYWWPGQVVTIEKLPEDIQTEFQKKPLIAAVKFFQEDSFEFVKNYQQIYNYNCTQKEEFIKKGLDKYRTKSKDGSNYMDKFPEDVKTAEILTGGNPDILLNEKFNPEEKPDISGLFGEKKTIKKKRNRDDFIKKIDSEIRRRVTHPRFLQENDYEVRIRKQPKNIPSTISSNFPSGIYPCHVCGFTATRVNIIICHLKNHRFNKDTETNLRSKLKHNISKSKQNNVESQKRKYIRKSLSNKIKIDSGVEFGKRKYCKQVEKLNKKKKTDPELREKLLADWNVDTDEDEPLYTEKSVNVRIMDISINNKSLKNSDEINILKTVSSKNNSDGILLLQASNNLLQETDDLSNLSILKDIPRNLNQINAEQNNTEKLDNISLSMKRKESFHFKKTTIESTFLNEKDDKKSRLSCFDFDEDDIPEPSISSVRKIPRSLGSKNMSIKKEIIKEFEMIQALKHDEHFLKNDEICKDDLKINKQCIFEEKKQIIKNIKHNEVIIEEENKGCQYSDENNEKLEKSIELCETHLEIVEIFEVEKEDEEINIKKGAIEKKFEKEKIVKIKVENKNNIELKDQDNNSIIKTANQEIIEDSDVHKEIEKEVIKKICKDEKIEFQLLDKNKTKEIKKNESKEIFHGEKKNLSLQSCIKDDILYKTPVLEAKQSLQVSEKDKFSKNYKIEVENNTNLSTDSVFEKNNSDIEVLSNFNSNSQLSKYADKSNTTKDNLNFTVKKRRGRPKKNLTEDISSDNEHLKSDDLMKKIKYDYKMPKSKLDRSGSFRKCKPNQKYQPLNLQKFDSKSSKTDESLCESESKLQETKDKIKMDIKVSNSKGLIDTIKNLKSSINSVDNTDSIRINTMKNTCISNSENKKFIKEQNNILATKDILEQSKGNSNKLKEEKNIEDERAFEVQQNFDVDIVYPKKCQIKKFEHSKIDFTDNNSVKCLNSDLNDHLHKVFNEKKDMKGDLKINKTQNETLIRIDETNQISNIFNKEVNIEKNNSTKMTMENKLLLIKSTNDKLNDHCESDDIEKHASDMDIKLKKGKFNDNQFDSFQDAFVKTLQIENSLKHENIDDMQTLEKNNINAYDIKKLSGRKITMVENLVEKPKITNFPITNNFDNIQDVLGNKLEEKSEETISIANDKNIIQPSTNSEPSIKNSNLVSKNAIIKSNKDLEHLDESENSLLISSGVDIKSIVPVKKREKPRIIENVALKEPMLLKTKLIEKHVGKIGKHKLESDNLKTDDSKSFPKTKIIKTESVISQNKNIPQTLIDNNLTISKKIIKTLKSEDDSSIKNIRHQQIVTAVPKTVSEVLCTEKYIQQSSQSLVDMELDINSMPFVLCEDVLTPESIEQMPVLISSVLPTKIPVTNSLTTTLTTPTKQILNMNQPFDSSKEISECPKKKSGTPTILKNKSKAKPTITSIKTIVPPLTSTKCKGNHKVNTSTLKTSLANQKTPGKYVIVQTSGHQQAYSTHPKVAIPTSKGSGNAQIVQQGSKVVILTSPQSGQSGQKVLPLNSISKALNSRKVQRIITSKHGQQVYTSVSPQTFVGSKTILTSSEDFNSPTTSKMVGQKMLSQQQSSKNVSTQLPGPNITKSCMLGGLPQGILTKDGIFTPLHSASLGGKTIVSSKTLVTKNFPRQATNILKNTLTSMNQSISNKTIINSQGIVSKGTVLTPITGSQVKALAAKNVKGNKLQYQLDQHKVKISGIQTNPKVSISSSLIRSNANLKTSSVMILQKSEFKNIGSNKKDIKQSNQKQLSAATVLSPNSMTIQQKAKTMLTGIEQNIINSKNINRSVKLTQKLVTEKVEESLIFKTSKNDEALSLKSKIVEHKRQIASVPISKPDKSTDKNFPKKVSNIGHSSVPSPSNINTSFSINVPPLEFIDHEKIPKKEQIFEQISISSKRETNSQPIEGKNTIESKLTVQPQIMAIPTENSDGTQTYVLVTVDEQGHIIPLDNNALMSLDGISNLDGSRTLYIDSSSLNESGNVDNIILQIDNGSFSNIHSTNVPKLTPPVITETLSSSATTLTTNQDILAAALANTDFQHEIGISECSPSTSMTSFTQTSLINQTILQSTIIPPTEPISSPLVLETSLTLNQPIMTPLELPSSLSVQSDLTPITSRTIVPTSIELPITDDNQNVSFISTTEPLLQISNNSVSQFEESIKTASLKNVVDMKISTNVPCIIEENLVKTINTDSEIESKSVSDVSYSFSIAKNDFENKHFQTTPSMPIIDDTFNANNGFDSTNTSAVVEDNLRNYVTKTSEELIQDLTGNDSLQENNDTIANVSNDKTCSIQEIISKTPEIILGDMQNDCVSSQQNDNPSIEQSGKKITSKRMKSLKTNKETLETDDYINEEAYVVSSETSAEVQCSHGVQSYVVTIEDSKPVLVIQESLVPQEEKKKSIKNEEGLKNEECFKNKELSSQYQSENPFSQSKLKKTVLDIEKMTENRDKKKNISPISNLSLQDISNQDNLEKCKITFINERSELCEGAISQPYKQFIRATNIEVPSQSTKSKSTQEDKLSLPYKIMDMDENDIDREPLMQSYEISKESAISQSYKNLSAIDINSPTQSYVEMMEVNETKTIIKKSIDDSNFSIQTYEVEKVENIVKSMETETEIRQEGKNSPSQSNDVNVDCIGTTSLSTNNLGLNEDETASSSYVPETPENQERDQDQESAISTSSYEIPPCEELNIASSSVIPDRSVQSEHSSIHNNGVPEITNSSFDLNPDSSSTQIHPIPTSNYENQIIIEQRVSTSYEVPISIGNLEETGSQNYVTDSSDERNETSNYYSHPEEVTESYYENMCKQSRSRLETNSEEESTPSYYENNTVDITSEPSQSYFNQETVTPSYSNHISPSYYDSRAESETSQSYYTTHELNRSTQQNIEATQSFYQENSDEQRLHQQGEAIPTYTDRYSHNYVSENSPLDRHDLVESSGTTRSMDR